MSPACRQQAGLSGFREASGDRTGASHLNLSPLSRQGGQDPSALNPIAPLSPLAPMLAPPMGPGDWLGWARALAWRNSQTRGRM